MVRFCQVLQDQNKSTAVIRLHGPDRSGIEKKTGSIWNQIVELKDEDLDKVVEIIHYLKNKKVNIYV